MLCTSLAVPVFLRSARRPAWARVPPSLPVPQKSPEPERLTPRPHTLPSATPCLAITHSPSPAHSLPCRHPRTFTHPLSEGTAATFTRGRCHPFAPPITPLAGCLCHTVQSRPALKVPGLPAQSQYRQQSGMRGERCSLLQAAQAVPLAAHRWAPASAVSIVDLCVVSQRRRASRDGAVSARGRCRRRCCARLLLLPLASSGAASATGAMLLLLLLLQA